jgi:decaprenylphospho-beta-D-ribofuranose 2-oxidase
LTVRRFEAIFTGANMFSEIVGISAPNVGHERDGMTLPCMREQVMNWSKTQLSSCYVYKARDNAGIVHALAAARARGLSVIAHGSGHSYTDAALNTNGVILDLTGMRRILSWDPERGIMRAEPGVTLRDVVRLAMADGWWPVVTPSTADATLGGCVAMNVNGKNAWKRGSFGEHLLSLTILLASGQALTLSPESDPQLFQALVGGAGLLGIITSVTLQLQRITAGGVDVRSQSATSIGEILSLFQQEQSADFLEAWVDGFAGGRTLGRGIVTISAYSDVSAYADQRPHASSHLSTDLARCAGGIGRSAVKGGVRVTNGTMYCWSRWWNRGGMRRRSLVRSTFYPAAVFAGYRALLPQGSETFQAFVPRAQAELLFNEILRRSQANHFIPLWCIIKQHRRDPFLLSYQVDGYSLEANYQVVPQTVQRLRTMLRELMELVIMAGGRFYLAKDSLLTYDLYRRSVGDRAVETFMQLKQLYDPEMLLQSNLFHRIFQASLQ